MDIGKEGELQGQIKSVVRDLEIMLRITTEQKEVIEKFEKTMQCLANMHGGNGITCHSIDMTGGVSIEQPDAELLLDEIQSSIDDLEEMRRSADDISASVSLYSFYSEYFGEPRKKAPKCSLTNTDMMAFQLDYLISLKQQQVTVVQAWQSMKQGEDNQKQNVTLLVFTVVTVIFVGPLSSNDTQCLNRCRMLTALCLPD